MKQQTPSRSKGPAKSRRPSREDLNQQARDRKRDKKHRGNTAGSRAGASSQNAGKKGATAEKDPRIGSKKPVDLGAITPSSQLQVKPEPVKKVAMSAQEELRKLERDDRLDSLLERIEAGETLDTEDQNWVDAQLDRIDELMQKLGLSYDDDEEEETKEEDMMRLLRGGN